MTLIGIWILLLTLVGIRILLLTLVGIRILLLTLVGICILLLTLVEVRIRLFTLVGIRILLFTLEGIRVRNFIFFFCGSGISCDFVYKSVTEKSFQKKEKKSTQNLMHSLKGKNKFFTKSRLLTNILR